MKKILLFVLFIFCFQLNFAQKGNISGSLIDTAGTEQSVGYATISVFKLGDSIITTYRLSDEEGKFVIKNLPINTTYKLVINAFQYTVLRKEVLLSAENPDIDLGKIILSSQENNLDEFVVSGEIPPIFVRNDTVEFNASSFKTLPTAVVEDLLKKLPGVTVGSDGSILVNGKQVSKILVDGREFFGGNQQIATKNLPANIIDKVQVSDDKEALRRDPNLTVANTPQIINLKLKKEIKKGAFGKLYAGAGPNQLFEIGGIINLFKDTMQVSILGFGNNVNKAGFSFSEIMKTGGFSRSGFNSLIFTGEGVEVDNISFGGNNGGQTLSSAVGANFNTISKNGLKLNLKYFYGFNDNKVKTITNNNQNIGEEKLITNNISYNQNKSETHSIGANLEWKIDSLSEFSFRPNISINSSQNNNLVSKTSKDKNADIINSNNNTINNNGGQINYSIYSDYEKVFKKEGRVFFCDVEVENSNQNNKNYNTSNVIFYNPISNITIDQLRSTIVKNSTISFYADYDEPISEDLLLVVSSSIDYINNENALSTFYRDSVNKEYTIVEQNLTETVNQKGYKTTSSMDLNWDINDKLMISPGLTYNTISIENSFIKYPKFNQDYHFLAPNLNFKYKHFSGGYNASFSPPDIRYIQPIANNIDPLFIQKGNPNIKPSVRHYMSVDYHKYDVKKQINKNYFVSGGLVNNSVITSNTVDSNGVQTSLPININGVNYFNFGSSIGKTIKTNKRQFTYKFGLSGNYQRNIVLVNQIQSFSRTFSIHPYTKGSINLNDKIEILTSYYVTYNKSTYDNDFYRDIDFFTHKIESEFILRLPKKFVWETNYRLQYNTQRVAGFNNYIQIWNAGLTYLFLKNDRGQLKLSINDILNTNNRRYVYITGNSVNDVLTNNLGRHGLITFTYNIQNFGQKVGGRERFFGF